MPYSGASDKSLPANVKKMSAKKRKQWVAVWNSAYNSCTKDGGSTKSCETKAFKEANGVVKQTMRNPKVRQAWDGYLQGLRVDVPTANEPVERALAFARMREQLWDALDNAEQTADKWAWPIDIFIDDDGGLFSIVAQAGKLFSVPLSVKDDNVTLGTWVQVKEVFEPVAQTSFTIRRTAEGQYRFVGVAATSVLNRVAQIDSRDLFDSFVEDTAETGDWPRIDFYHLGKYDEGAWEFGTVDFHARDNFCYIVSGVFDEDHPLTQAAVRAYGEDPDKWGFSIEFYALGEPEMIVVDPEVKVPVYKRGRIIRVSIVREADAASLFTRIGSITEERTRMRREITDALAEFFGTDDAATKFLDTFGIDVDEINRTVEDDNLIHRTKTKTKAKPAAKPAAKTVKQAVADAKKKVAAAAAKEDEDDLEEDEEDEVEEDAVDETEETEAELDNRPIELDEVAIAAVAEQVADQPVFQAVIDAVEALEKKVDELTKARTADAKEIAALKAVSQKASTRLAQVEKGDREKKSEFLQDMPARNSRKATYRPRQDEDDEDDEGEDENSSDIAERTLAKIPNRY